MSAPFTFVGNNTTYVPTLHDLTIAFVKNPAAFPVNKYIQNWKTDKQIGFYWNYENNSQNRFVDSSYSVWADGNDAPTLTNAPSDPFNFKQFTCQRYAYTRRYGYLGVEQAQDQDILGMGSQFLAMQGMTNRCARLHQTLTTSGNWPTANTATATSLGGGLWGSATAALPYIKKSIIAAAIKIQQSTSNVVQLNDLQIVVNPNTAAVIAESQEMIDQLKQSPITYAEITGTDQFSQYNVPDKFCGLSLVVDGTIMNTASPGEADSFTFTFPDNYALIITKQNAVNSGGARAFSTVNLPEYQSFEMFVYNDVKNRRYELQCIENCDTSANCIVAPASGFLITHVAS